MPPDSRNWGRAWRPDPSHPDYARTTDSEGKADFTPKTGNTYLIVAHHSEPNESGEGYKGTKYSATLTIFVPDLCPCCTE